MTVNSGTMADSIEIPFAMVGQVVQGIMYQVQITPTGMGTFGRK